MQTRRDFGKAVLMGLPLAAHAARINSTVAGVGLGTITYSFRDLPRTPGKDNVDDLIKALTACGIGEIELYSPNIEPAPASAAKPAASGPSYGVAAGPRPGPTPEQLAARRLEREALRKWRIETPASYYQDVRKKFDAAGISIFAYTLGFNDQFTEDEIDAGFNQAKALGVDLIASSTTLSAAKRVAPFADKHKVRLAVHGYARVTDPNQFGSPESFATALSWSKYMRVNLDIGHFTAANYDAVAYIKENHQNITHLHIKDRHRNDGVNEPFGDGDTPIKPVLQLIRDNKWPLRAFVEYEYPGMGTSVEEVKKCLDYLKNCLA
ncbi:MAG TPA: TIM barrel protein [Bryobacteraceae bacterium]|nr:TIM barrel protein [Bryobacteraceae bacterium]